jgi:hypothetical protein
MVSFALKVLKPVGHLVEMSTSFGKNHDFQGFVQSHEDTKPNKGKA